MTLEELRARAADIADRLDEIAELDEVDDETRTEQDALYAESDTVLDQIRDTEQRAEQRARLAAAVANQEVRAVPGVANPPPVPGVTSDDPYDLRAVTPGFNGLPSREMRTRALTAIEQERDLADHQKRYVTRMVEKLDVGNSRLSNHILATGNPTYRTAWAKAVTGQSHLLDSDEQRAMEQVRALSLTGASGGFAVPFTLDPTVVLTNDGVVNPFRQLARIVQITTDDWNGVTSAGVTASYDAEATAVGDDAPTLVQPSISVHKAQAFVPASIEITQDWAGIADEIAREIADAKDRLEGSVFATGSGTNEPFGVVTAVAATTASRVSATTNNTFGLVDVYNTLEGLPARHRPRASWAANLNIINDIRQFGTANNYHGFLTDLAGDTPARLLGKPLFEASEMDGAIATGNDDVLLIGDFSRYVIVDRVGLAIEFIPHLFDTTNNRPTGQRGWYAYWRNGADSIDDNAFRILRV